MSAKICNTKEKINTSANRLLCLRNSGTNQRISNFDFFVSMDKDRPFQSFKSVSDEIISGASIAFAAFLLIVPGFFTDLIGLLLLIPFTRKILFNLTVKKKMKNNEKFKDKTIDGEVVEKNKDEL